MSLSPTAAFPRLPRHLAVTSAAAFVSLLSLIPLGFIGWIAFQFLSGRA